MTSFTKAILTRRCFRPDIYRQLTGGGVASRTNLLSVWNQQQPGCIQRFSTAPDFFEPVQFPTKKRRKNNDTGKKKGKNKKNKTPEPPTAPRLGENGRLVMTNEWLQKSKIVSDFMDRYSINGRLTIGRYKDACNKMMFSYTQEMEELPGRAHLAVLKTTIENRSTLLPNVLAPSDASNVSENGFELQSTGYGESRKRAISLAALDALFQLHHDCGIDLANVPSARKILEEERKKQELGELSRAQMRLELVKSPIYKRPRFETYPSGKNAFQTDMSMRVGHSTKWLKATGTPAVSTKQSVSNAMLVAAGEPLEMILGKAQTESLNELIDAAPAKHMSPLAVDPLPLNALDILRKAIGSPQEQKERSMKVKATQARHEEAVAAKMEAKWQAKIQREQEKFANFKEHPSRGLSEELARYQEIMLRQEQARVLESGPQAAMQKIRAALPITAIRKDLIKALQNDQVVVVSGGTGSGKSTQCPQYILEDAIRRGQGPHTRIIVTQPRRIAAISVAERVADERGEQVGHSVGYSVRHNRKAPRSCGSIEFVTTGVLLRRLNHDRTLDGISHVMIDEVHERDINTDFLLVLLKDLVTKRPDLNVILMSATLDAESFSKYFANDTGKNVPFLSVPTKPRYPVETFHLEDLVGESGTSVDIPHDVRNMAKSLLQTQDQQLLADLDFAEKKASSQSTGDDLISDYADVEFETAKRARSSLRLQALREAVQLRQPKPSSSRTTQREIDILTVDLVASLAMHVAEQEQRQGRTGSVLCFLPGWDEIKAAMSAVGTEHRNLIVIPLHSSVPKEEQHRIFHPAPEGTVKVIFATNIAESSVTINDALAIVDSGLVREMNWDAESAMSTMETVPTSQASATQRKGRAGRVAPGKCYRIYSQGVFKAMSERATPEIQRAGLDSTCLLACGMTNDGVQSFLSRAMDPPPEDTVSHALNLLKMIGAIRDGPSGEALTSIGRLLSLLPVDPAIARMLIFGCVMQCLDPVLTAAACFSSRDPFYNPPGMREEAKAKRQTFSNSSDLVSTVRAYNMYNSIVKSSGRDAAWQWTQEHFISPTSMARISTTKSQLLHELHRLRLVPDSDLDQRLSKRGKVLRSDAFVNRNSDNESLCVGVWATGLPGNFATRKHLSNFGTFQTRTQSDTSIHPSSVTFHRKPPEDKSGLHDWYLYHEMIHSSQVFVRNVTSTMPGQIMLFGGLDLQRVDQTAQNNARSLLPGQMVLDGWVLVGSNCDETLDYLGALRQEINAAVVLKVMSPQDDLPETSQNIIDAASKTLRIMDGTYEDGDAMW